MLDHPCRIHRIAGHVLTGLVSLVLLAAGVGKLAAPPPPDAPVILAPATVYTLAVIDFLLAIGLWVPRLSTLSFVLAVGYFGGATATHLTHGLPIGVPAGLIVFTLAAAYFKVPELYLRLLGKESLASGPSPSKPEPHPTS